MMGALLFALTVLAALGCGLMAGVFFAFSVFVMRALGRLPPAQGMAAMQAINVAAITPLFMLALFGTALVCVALAIAAFPGLHEPAAGYRLAGGAVYLVGAILVTAMFNIPRNNALAAANPESADGERIWAGYLASWTAWNHVRAIACFAAAVLLTVALWM